ncbi:MULTISPECIES: DUF3363 domain-containing protein [Bradyrhizobium]|uniref:DUF3363 domain-containing protein n=1 Tax=Bradyrhizobium TaxID=374 RepID=UPI001FD9A70E|nr:MULTISPECIES: DUF3363 domain-containing protein [Bradyrhizobium]
MTRSSFGRNLIESLHRELDTIGRGLAEEMGLEHYPLMQVSRLRGSIADRLSLASLRFGMIDHWSRFQIVPWSSSLQRELSNQVSGIAGQSASTRPCGQLP